ncbi:APC family permease [Kibdelosporangium phytohabitans]|uniref:Amino acid permease n=1 Tax=Kibdelosporangium phytohabitans TaxID=860235 RepID=A0A0N9I5X9_9PSEU|nr:APC family permease [Kibdelosporangium phytohabitans]ALG15502.1 amino acid permease [Kibdelosporangium phytohabitans]MBE1464451.1 amino acid transporter [Kibdelosporangium phytohabitans]
MGASTSSFTRGLAKPRLGVAQIVFFVVAASGPLYAIAGGISTTYAVTGIVAVPLSFVLLAPVLALFAVGYGVMSRHITNAGAFYPYVANGIGKPAGIAVSFVAVLAYNCIQIGVYGLFGWSVADFLRQKAGIETPWWLWALVVLAVVGVLGVLRVDLNAKVLGVVLGLECLTIVVIDAVGLANPAPSGDALAPLDPSNLFVTGVGAVFALSVAVFTGFEGAATYGEECRDPARTVARATYVAIGLTAVLYTVSSLAMAVGVGPSEVVALSQQNGPGVFFGISGRHLGSTVTDIAYVLFLTSQFASLLSFHNAVARYFFALGREGVLPDGLGRTNRRNGAPVAGSLTQSVVALLVVAGFAITGREPIFELFTWLGATASTGVVLIMTMVSVSVIVFFRGRRGPETLWQRVIAPALAAVLLAVVLVLIIVNFHVVVGTSEDSPLRWVLPGLLLLAAVAGFVRSLVLRSGKPAVYANVGGIGTTGGNR